MLNQLAQCGEKLTHLDISTPTALASSFLLANSHLSRLIYGTITASLTSVLAYLDERLTLLNQVSFFNFADPLKRLYIKICGGKKALIATEQLSRKSMAKQQKTNESPSLNSRDPSAIF